MTKKELTHLLVQYDPNRRLANTILEIYKKHKGILDFSDDSIARCWFAGEAIVNPPIDELKAMTRAAANARQIITRKISCKCPVCHKKLIPWNDDLGRLSFGCPSSHYFRFHEKDTHDTFADMAERIKAIGNAMQVTQCGVYAIQCPACSKEMDVRVGHHPAGYIECASCNSTFPIAYFDNGDFSFSPTGSHLNLFESRRTEIRLKKLKAMRDYLNKEIADIEFSNEEQKQQKEISK